MKFLSSFFKASVRSEAIEFTSLRRHIAVSDESSVHHAAAQSFLNEFKRLLRNYRRSHFSRESSEIDHLIIISEERGSVINKFTSIIFHLLQILLQKFEKYHESAELLLPLLEAGLFIMSREILLLQPFVDQLILIEKMHLLKEKLPVIKKYVMHNAPVQTAEDILLRSARETSLALHEEYLLSKGLSKSGGTVLAEIVKSMPKKCSLHRYFLGGHWSFEELTPPFMQDLNDIMSAYKSRMFSTQSDASQKVLKAFEGHLSSKAPNFLEILELMTRFIARKNLLNTQGELAKQLFWLWQAGLWLVSQHPAAFEMFLNISTAEKTSLLQGHVWAEYCWEQQTVK